MSCASRTPKLSRKLSSNCMIQGTTVGRTAQERPLKTSPGNSTMRAAFQRLKATARVPAPAAQMGHCRSPEPSQRSGRAAAAVSSVLHQQPHARDTSRGDPQRREETPAPGSPPLVKRRMSSPCIQLHPH